MDVAGRENIHVTINDAVMSALKTVGDYFLLHFIYFQNHFLSFQRAARDSIVYLPGATIPYVGIENVAYTDEDHEDSDTIIKSYLQFVYIYIFFCVRLRRNKQAFIVRFTK